ncbi:outer membrane protein assembly factor BamB family protein [Caballeronia grimmiae]|uniref:outer membrane protein assembly factor BamB family protein n=1 Tax=Caballeronia grimmiae TaxID=1071679 RepID=UPI0038B90DB9
MNIKPALCVAALAAIANLGYAEWRYPHADAANTGFAKVITAPAKEMIRAATIGPLASGAGPVIGPDGTVYIGNLNGQVLAFHADGTPAWSRQLPAGQWVTSSPVVGADGSVYVVSETRMLVAGETSIYRYESTLHKFSASGGWLYQAPFPQRWGNTQYSSRGDANAPPNIWSSNGVEAIIVPAVYSTSVYTSLRLVAFSTSGAVLGDSLVMEPPPGTVSGGTSWHDLLDLLPPWGFDTPSGPPSCADFSVCLPDDTTWPLSNVAIWQSDKGEAPTVMVSDARQDLVGYTFDPTHGFTERFRIHDANRVASTGPLILPDGHTVVAANGEKLNRLTFAGPNFIPVADSTGNLGVVAAVPTRLPNGRLVANEHKGGLAGFSADNVLSNHVDLPGESIVAAAASCNLVYVATAGALTTLDIATLQPVAALKWHGGGRSAPVISSAGYVYATAATSNDATNFMFVFPPLNPPATSFHGTACDATTITFGGALTN